MKILSIIGARPSFIKHAPMSVELRKRHHDDIIIHTGQHYDFNLSDRFFRDLNLPDPDYNLEVGSNSQGKQTADIIERTEQVLVKEKPDVVIVYGDTNSTMGGAIAASKIHIPLAHVEAGLRSFDRRMPEELNRIVTDHLADLLFCPTIIAFNNLMSEGVCYDNLQLVGDIMVDTYNMFNQAAEKNLEMVHNLGNGEYYIATIHRASNTDNSQNLKNIVEAFEESGKFIVFPMHPRTNKFMHEYGLYHHESNVLYTEPLGYLEMLCMMKHAKKILTDSGGMQKEAYIMKVPCITLRENTEWLETLVDDHNILVGTDKQKILNAILSKQNSYKYGHPFGCGDTAQRIVNILEEKYGG